MIKKGFVVIGRRYGGGVDIVGVFTSKEKASDRAIEWLKKWAGMGSPDVKEMDIDVE